MMCYEFLSFHEIYVNSRKLCKIDTIKVTKNIEAENMILFKHLTRMTSKVIGGR